VAESELATNSCRSTGQSGALGESAKKINDANVKLQHPTVKSAAKTLKADPAPPRID